MKVIVAAFFLLLASASPAWAFGATGHVTTCEMAYRMLTDTSRAEVNRILRVDGEYKAFNRACLDEDMQPQLRRSSHFLNLPRDQLSLTGVDCFGASACVVTAINGDWAVLRSATSTDPQKAAALKGIGHWVGDIHQPLHVSFADDRGGNFIKKQGQCSSNNLHSVWDTCILENKVFNLNLLERTLGWGKFTKAYRGADRLLAAVTPEQRAVWIRSEPWQWAAESYAVTLRPDVEYCTLKNGECWYEAQRREYAEPQPMRKVQATDAYLTLHAPIIQQRVTQASVRLAHVLNVAFDPAYVPPA